VTSENRAPQHEEAFRHFMQHRTMLAAYLRAIVHERSLAEEVLTDVSLEITRSWQRYDPARSFAAWARGLARRVALTRLRAENRQPALLEPDVLEIVGADLETFGDQARLEERKRLLEECVGKLSEPHQRLLQMRYFQDLTYDHIAQKLRRTVEALYTAFSRIHKALRECVERKQESA